MSQWVLKPNGNAVPRRTMRPLCVEELRSSEEQKKREIFGALIERRWGTSINPPTDTAKNDEDWEEYEDPDEPARTVHDIEDTVDSRGHLLNQQPAYDRLINAEVQLQQGDNMMSATVRKRASDPDGKVVGT
jgi:hypothetical protein